MIHENINSEAHGSIRIFDEMIEGLSNYDETARRVILMYMDSWRTQMGAQTDLWVKNRLAQIEKDRGGRGEI